MTLGDAGRTSGDAEPTAVIATAPASGGLFRKRPCTERDDAPRPARRPTEAYHCGTVREGNEAGGDAAALECRDLRE